MGGRKGAEGEHCGVVAEFIGGPSRAAVDLVPEVVVGGGSRGGGRLRHGRRSSSSRRRGAALDADDTPILFIFSLSPPLFPVSYIAL